MKKITDWMDGRSRVSFILMLVVGVYLFYAIYKMYQGIGEMTSSPIPIYIFIGLFAVVGAGLLIFGLFAFVSGHYRRSWERDPSENTDSDGPDDGSAD